MTATRRALVIAALSVVVAAAFMLSARHRGNAVQNTAVDVTLQRVQAWAAVPCSPPDPHALTDRLRGVPVQSAEISSEQANALTPAIAQVIADCLFAPSAVAYLDSATARQAPPRTVDAVMKGELQNDHQAEDLQEQRAAFIREWTTSQTKPENQIVGIASDSGGWTINARIVDKSRPLLPHGEGPLWEAPRSLFGVSWFHRPALRSIVKSTDPTLVASAKFMAKFADGAVRPVSVILVWDSKNRAWRLSTIAVSDIIDEHLRTIHF